MAIKMFCDICEKPITKLSSSGKEICSNCQEIINTAFLELTNAEKKFQEAINEAFLAVKREYTKFSNMQTQKLQEVKAIINNTRPEITQIVKEITTENKKKKEAPKKVKEEAE